MEEKKGKRAGLLEALTAEMKKTGGIMKTAQLYKLSFTDRMIREFTKDGILKRIKSGYYCMEDMNIPEEALVSRLFNDGVLCMDTALYCYGYIETRPLAWHIAVDKDTSKSRFSMDYPLIKPYYAEKKVLQIGVADIDIEGNPFKIYNKERLICDCIRFENSLEHDTFK